MHPPQFSDVLYLCLLDHSLDTTTLPYEIHGRNIRGTRRLWNEATPTSPTDPIYVLTIHIRYETMYIQIGAYIQIPMRRWSILLQNYVRLLGYEKLSQHNKVGSPHYCDFCNKKLSNYKIIRDPTSDVQLWVLIRSIFRHS